MMSLLRTKQRCDLTADAILRGQSCGFKSEQVAPHMHAIQ